MDQAGGFMGIRLQSLPFALLLMDLLYYRSSLLDHGLGLGAGQCVFFVLFILPLLLKRSVLKTPRILKRLFGELEATGAA